MLVSVKSSMRKEEEEEEWNYIKQNVLCVL